MGMWSGVGAQRDSGEPWVAYSYWYSYWYSYSG
jgi:hypothetical protein